MYVHFQLLEAIGGNIVLRTRTEFRISCLIGAQHLEKAKCCTTGRSECMIDYRVQPIKPKLPIVFSWFHPHSNHKSAIFPCLNFVHLKKHPKPRERKGSMVVRGGYSVKYVERIRREGEEASQAFTNIPAKKS